MLMGPWDSANPQVAGLVTSYAPLQMKHFNQNSSMNYSLASILSSARTVLSFDVLLFGANQRIAAMCHHDPPTCLTRPRQIFQSPAPTGNPRPSPVSNYFQNAGMAAAGHLIQHSVDFKLQEFSAALGGFYALWGDSGAITAPSHQVKILCVPCSSFAL